MEARLNMLKSGSNPYLSTEIGHPNARREQILAGDPIREKFYDTLEHSLLETAMYAKITTPCLPQSV